MIQSLMTKEARLPIAPRRLATVLLIFGALTASAQSGAHRGTPPASSAGVADSTRDSSSSALPIAGYALQGDDWLTARLPAPLLRVGPIGLRWWQWIALVPVAAAIVTIGSLGGRALGKTLRVATRHTAASWDDLAVERLSGPLTAFSMLLVALIGAPFLNLEAGWATSIYLALRIGFALTLFWAVWRLIDIARQSIARTRWATALPASRSLIPLGARLTKVAVAAFGVAVILSTLGYPVTTLVAGLGIGGLALALAAQKTVENLFGAFSIGIDQPFREGDFVKVDDFVGTVEAIGLRSTRFRTLDRTIVTLPNGRLADMRLESFSARDRLRLAAVIGLVYETTAAQMRQALEGFERVLRAHPKIWPDAVVVRFGELAASSLNIEVMAWFTTADWSEFQCIRQDILLAFMDVVERAGTSFAFPTTTVHVAPTHVAPTHVAPTPRGAATHTVALSRDGAG